MGKNNKNQISKSNKNPISKTNKNPISKTNKNPITKNNKNQTAINKNNKNKFVPKVAALPPKKSDSEEDISEDEMNKMLGTSDNSDIDSEDDISEEEMKKMLGTSDNSDIDSDEFSEEENIEVQEAKVNKKRKLSLSDEEENIKRIKSDNVEEVDEDDEDDEDDDDYNTGDEVETDDSFINDEEEDGSDDEDNEGQKNNTVKKVTKKERKEIDPEVLLQTKKENQERRDKQMTTFREMSIDSSNVLSNDLNTQIQNRLVQRMKKTIVISNIPVTFKNHHVKILVPNMVSCVMPYNSYLHKIIGTVFVDMKSEEEAIAVAKQLNKTSQTVDKLKAKKLNAMVQNKCIDDVSKYNCNRLVVSNLHCKITHAEITELLPKAGRIEMLPMQSVDRKANRTAFVEYGKVEDAIADYDNKHGTVFKGCPMHIKFQMKKMDNTKVQESRKDKKTLVLIGLKKNTRESDIKELFPQAISISLVQGKARALIGYNDELECAIDKTNAYKNKLCKKWRISYNTIKSVAKKEDNAPVASDATKAQMKGKKFEKKGKKFEKKVQEKKFEKKMKEMKVIKETESESKHDRVVGDNNIRSHGNIPKKGAVTTGIEIKTKDVEHATIEPKHDHPVTKKDAMTRNSLRKMKRKLKNAESESKNDRVLAHVPAKENNIRSHGDIPKKGAVTTGIEIKTKDAKHATIDPKHDHLATKKNAMDINSLKKMKKKLKKIESESKHDRVLAHVPAKEDNIRSHGDIPKKGAVTSGIEIKTKDAKHEMKKKHKKTESKSTHDRVVGVNNIRSHGDISKKGSNATGIEIKTKDGKHEIDKRQWKQMKESQKRKMKLQRKKERKLQAKLANGKV